MIVHATHTMRSRKRCPEQDADVSSTKRARQTARRGFLDLPRELRDIIYEHSLVSTESINVCQLATPSRNAKKLGISTAFLRVSRQIYCEAVKVMYGLNTFEAKISLDPRIPHSYNHDLKLYAQQKGRTFKNPMVNEVKRLIVRLEFAPLSLWPGQDPSFPAEVLQAFVLGGSPDIVILRPGCIFSYMENLQCFNALLATANAALAVTRGSLLSTYLLSCVNARNKGTHVVTLHTPQSSASPGFLEFPRACLGSQSIDTTCEVFCQIPSRFRSTGQMRLAETIGE
jgi:hypothetical protein